jgi:FADH2-dependent halogenase
LDSGTAASDTVIIRLNNKWFWIIPVSAQKISVGCVLDQEEYARYRKSPGEVFTAMWQSSAEMRARMKDARLVNTIQTTSDFSYYNKRLVGPRLLRVGDAAGFMDPIFSAGVYLAMYSGKLGANVVLESLETNDDGAKRLRRYEKKVFRAMRYYWTLVESFYTTPFMELFMEPRHKHRIPEAVLAILAGELEGGWPVEIRRQVFLWLVKAQRFWPIVPRISFEEQPDGVIQTTEALMT